MYVTKNQVVKLPLITQGDQILIDARLLHKQLEVKSIFANWIRSRIEDFGFEEGNDFFLNSEKTSLLGGRPKKDYHLTIDMAKELAMLERNEIGRQIRRYFIIQEKKARGITQLPSHNEIFKGIKGKRVNDRVMLPYKEVLARCGYSTRSSSSNRRSRYWMHFIKEGNLLYITQEFAQHLFHQKRVMSNRAALQAMQAVIPMNFGDTSMLKGGNYGTV